MQKLSHHLLITFLILIISLTANSNDRVNTKLDLEPFSNANQLALQDYSKAKKHVIDQLDNLIIISGESAFWYQNSKLIKTTTYYAKSHLKYQFCV